MTQTFSTKKYVHHVMNVCLTDTLMVMKQRDALYNRTFGLL